jgi:hypothetical protein
MPLGTRLHVVGPRYVDVGLVAELEIERGYDPREVEKKARQTLEDRLALVQGPNKVEVRAPGVPLARTEVAAWLRTVAGVARLERLALMSGKTSTGVDEIQVSRDGLPRLAASTTTINAERPARGGGR